MTEAAWYVAQRAWERSQPQLFFELWPDDGLDDTHADSRSCGPGEPVCVVEPGAAASPEAAGLEPRLTAGDACGVAQPSARADVGAQSTGLEPRRTEKAEVAPPAGLGTRARVDASPAVSRVLNPGDTEPRRAIVHGELTVPRAAPPSPSSGRGSVSPLHTTAPGRKTSQSSAAGGRR